MLCIRVPIKKGENISKTLLSSVFRVFVAVVTVKNLLVDLRKKKNNNRETKKVDFLPLHMEKLKNTEDKRCGPDVCSPRATCGPGSALFVNVIYGRVGPSALGGWGGVHGQLKTAGTIYHLVSPFQSRSPDCYKVTVEPFLTFISV